MDLLLSPENPSIPISKTPYVCEEIWDGGPFLTYPRRCGKMRSIPMNIRTGPLVSDEPYGEYASPTPKEELQSFYQAWLFFGLLAEFQGLNQQEDGTRLVDAAFAEQELTNWNSACILIEDGKRYLTGVKVLALASDPSSLLKFQSNISFLSRLAYLKDCLRMTYMVLDTVLSDKLDETIIISIAALGSLLSTSSHNLAIALMPSVFQDNKTLLTFPKVSKYLEPQSELEAKMLELGWCISEIERMRSFCSNIFTLHYMSRLERTFSNLDHSGCTSQRCNASQIDRKHYRTRHINQNCSCGDIEIDEESLREILSGGSYPVLNLESFAEGDETLPLLETYSSNVPYVALSHVWADGLGNPLRTCLPRCQIKRIAGLIADLYNATEVQSGTSANHVPYRLWIDTLLCPINAAAKTMAHTKMADVYRNATHVLVLDSSLSLYSSESVHPLELSLRVFGCSNWMRRLWTLQEGALSKSLYFQFADRAIRDFDLVLWLFQESAKDTRLMSASRDMMDELRLMHSFFSNSIPNDWSWITQTIFPAGLTELQRGLYFRSVSVPLDEPLCIATLLSLDIKEVTILEDEKSRMMRIWTLIAKKFGGIPARIIFRVDNPIDKSGWRWAPRSLLASERDSPNSFVRKLTLLQEKIDGAMQPRNGIPTALGLRVQFPGTLLRTQPRVPGVPFHPWPGVKNTNDHNMVFARHDESGKWFRIYELVEEATPSLSQGTRQQDHIVRTGNSLCDLIHEGNYALIYDDEVAHCLLAKVLVEGIPTPTTQGYYHVQTIKHVHFDELDATWCLIADEMHKMANQVVQDNITSLYLKASNMDPGSGEHEKALDELEKHFKNVALNACHTNPPFAKAVLDILSPDLENPWKFIIAWFSDDTVLLNLSKDHIWIIE